MPFVAVPEHCTVTQDVRFVVVGALLGFPCMVTRTERNNAFMVTFVNDIRTVFVEEGLSMLCFVLHFDTRFFLFS